MKTILTFVLAILPLTLGAVNRSVTIDNPGTVYAGQAFLIETHASTDATDSEQIGFYHGQYSYDNGASWNWFTSDVNAGKSASRSGWISAGSAYSQIIIMVKIAFRGGGAGDVDYNGNAIDWGGSWGSNSEPPAKKLTITVQPPPNQPPTITWVQPNSTSSSSAYVNQWTPVQARANDGDGNLTNTFVWREWIPHAFNGGGNGYECYSDANGYTRATPGGVQFQAQAQDSNSATSSVIYHTITYSNRDPSVSYQFLNSVKNPFSINGSGNAEVGIGQTFYVRVSGSDPDGSLAQLYLRMLDTASQQWHYEQVGASGASASYDFGPYSASMVGIYDTWAHAQDSSGGSYTWQGNGWWGADSPDLEITNQAPGISATITPSTITFGQTVSVSFTATDADSNLYASGVLTDPTNTGGSNYRKPSGVDYPRLGWNGYGNDPGAWSSLNFSTDTASGSTNTKTGTYRPDQASSAFLFSIASKDAVGATNSTGPTIVVNKATPAGTFANRTIDAAGPTYTVQAGDLNAAFANPYSGAVTAPSGTVTYSIAGPGTNVTTGTVLSAGQSYTIRASYPGDGNYNATTKDSTWNILYDANADSDGDGLSNGLEDQLGTNPSGVGSNTNDSSNTTGMKIHRPN